MICDDCGIGSDDLDIKQCEICTLDICEVCWENHQKEHENQTNSKAS